MERKKENTCAAQFEGVGKKMYVVEGLLLYYCCMRSHLQGPRKLTEMVENSCYHGNSRPFGWGL